MKTKSASHSLAGKIIVLTGASGGIGRVISNHLSDAGARVLMVDIAVDSLRELAAALEQKYVVADLLTEADRASVAQRVTDEWGRLDALVNCAGINAFGLQDAISDEQVQRVIAVNLTAPILLTRKLLPLLEKGRSPVIVNLGSVFGHIGFAGFSLYSASKFGLHGYTESLRRELADTPVRVAWVSPRATRTAMNAGAVDQLNEELKVRYDHPERVARAVCAAITKPRIDRVLGFPEKFFARLNQLFPSLVDRSLKTQLPVIRKYSQIQKEQQA